MSDDPVKDFGTYLSTITDEAERARVLARAKLLGLQEAPEEAFEPPIRTLAEYLASTIDIPPVLVSPYLVVRGGLNATIGRAGKGKTVMQLNRLLRWSSGQPMFPGWTNAEGEDELAPAQPLKCLIIENEGAAGLFHRQIGIMLHAQDFMDEADRELSKENLFIWGDGGYSNLKLDDPNRLNGVRAGIEKWEPDIVFIEPFRGLWSGEENSSTDMAVVVDNLIGIAADYQVGVLLSHHERKSGAGEDGEKMSAGRGSTVLEGAVTVMENFESVKGGEFRELTWSKSRHHNPPNPVRMEWQPDSWWYRWVPEDAVGDSALTALRGNAEEPMSIADLSEATGEARVKLRPIMKHLEAEGKVKKIPSIHSREGSTGLRYRLPTDENNEGGIAL